NVFHIDNHVLPPFIEERHRHRAWHEGQFNPSICGLRVDGERACHERESTNDSVDEFVHHRCSSFGAFCQEQMLGSGLRSLGFGAVSGWRGLTTWGLRYWKPNSCSCTCVYAPSLLQRQSHVRKRIIKGPSGRDKIGCDELRNG